MSFRGHLNMFNARVTWCVVIWTWNGHIGTVLKRQSGPSDLETVTFLFLMRGTRIRSEGSITCEHESSLEEHPAGKVIVHVKFVTFMSYLELDLSTLVESCLEDYPQSIFILAKHHFGCATLHLLHTPSDDKHSFWQCVLAQVSHKPSRVEIDWEI